MPRENHSEFDLEAILSYMEQAVEKKSVKKNDFFSEEDELGKYIKLKCCQKRYYTMLDYLDHREEVHGEMLEVFDKSCKFISSYETKHEYSSLFGKNGLMNYLKDKVPIVNSIENQIKPYACPAVGCTKRYKNSNGLKYHLSHNNHQ